MKIDLTNNELIGLADKYIQELCRTGGKSFKMSVPVDSKDTDVVLSELLNRFETIIENQQIEIDKRLNKQKDYIRDWLISEDFEGLAERL